MVRYYIGIHPPYKYSSNLHHFSHHHLAFLSSLSPPLPFTTTVFFHRWPFIERDLFENSRDCMNGQWRWQHTTKKCGLFGCKVNIQCLFRLRHETYLTSILFSPTIYFSFSFPFSHVTLHR